MVVGSGIDLAEAHVPRLEGLKILWKGKADKPQTLLTAGRSASSPAASAAQDAKMVWSALHCSQLF